MMRSVSRRLASFLTLVSVCASPAPAGPPTWLGSGDIAAAANIELRIMNAVGSSSTGYAIPNTTPTTLLWDPGAPDDLILGGGGSGNTGGFLVRASFTGPGQVTSTLLAPTGSFAAPRQLSWDQTGTGIIVVTFTGQVHRVDATTGAVTAITSGTQPWGGGLNAGAMDRLTGDIYVATTDGDVWRIAPGASGAALFQSGLGAIQKILIDTTASPHSLYVVSSQSFRRVTLGGTPVVTPLFGTFATPPSPGTVVSADFDEHGDFVVATSDKNVHRLQNPPVIPAAGVTPVLLGQFAYQSSSAATQDVSVIGTSSTPFRLTLKSVPVLGAEVRIDNLPQPLGFGYLFLSTTTFLPVGNGPFFGLMPDLLTVTIMGLAPVPGGLLAFTGTPASLNIPQFGMTPYFAQTWDGVAVAFGPNGQLLGRSNVVRVTWQ